MQRQEVHKVLVRHTIRKQTEENETRVTGTMPSTHGILLEEHVNHLVCGKHTAHVRDPNQYKKSNLSISMKV